MDNPIRLHWLDPRNPQQPFPPVHLAMRDPNGLLAIGGDLSPQRLLRAYAQGIFPWFNPDEPILWWCPDPRASERDTCSSAGTSTARRIRRADYAVTLDQAFVAVLEACAEPRRRSHGTWLGDDMQHAYHELHRDGYAHSIEIWREGRLIGGLYGVALGRAFFGESMFSRETDGSKLALYWLCEQLAAWGFPLIDCQISSGHLLGLGARELPREEFLKALRPAVSRAGNTGRWQLDVAAPSDQRHLC
jgi:leucyl/phenylalanyl-tRNA---protein transferase